MTKLGELYGLSGETVNISSMAIRSGPTCAPQSHITHLSTQSRCMSVSMEAVLVCATHLDGRTKRRRSLIGPGSTSAC